MHSLSSQWSMKTQRNLKFRNVSMSFDSEAILGKLHESNIINSPLLYLIALKVAVYPSMVSQGWLHLIVSHSILQIFMIAHEAVLTIQEC